MNKYQRESERPERREKREREEREGGGQVVMRETARWGERDRNT